MGTEAKEQKTNNNKNTAQAELKCYLTRLIKV